jgi:hypothetical protein
VETGIVLKHQKITEQFFVTFCIFIPAIPDWIAKSKGYQGQTAGGENEGWRREVSC